MKTLGIIPARGGSKGIPRKNVLPLGGVPLIAYTIDAARSAAGIDRVVVSTDDDEIALLSTTWGAGVIRRPPELAGDGSSSEAAVLHALDAMAAAAYVPDVVVLLQCTSPLRRPGDLDAAIQLLQTKSYDSIFAGVATKPFRWRRDGAVMARVNFVVGDRPMRQDREPELVETGAFYVTRHDVWRATGLRLGGRIGCYELPFLYSFDIDEPDDFLLCEALLSRGIGGLNRRIGAI